MTGFEDTEEELTSGSPKRVFVICEGHKTEPDYLDCFWSAHRDDCSFEKRPVEKKSFDTDNSNRKDMMHLLDGEMIELSTKKYTPFFMITLVLRRFSELIGLDERIKKGLNERKDDLFKQFRLLAEQKNLLHGNTIGFNMGELQWFVSLAAEIVENRTR